MTTSTPASTIGILPSLEVLPLFVDFSGPPDMGWVHSFQKKAYSSYGGIARALLTKEIGGGVLPLEIFVAEVLSLPGQRNRWHVPIFLEACPTELVLRDPVFRTFNPSRGARAVKLPTRLRLGVESQSSLTKLQFGEWLSSWPGNGSTKISYKMLPMELMIPALKADAIDAIIAPSPWGMHIDAEGIAKRQPLFAPDKFVQRLAVVYHKEFLGDHLESVRALPRLVSAARRTLGNPAEFGKAACNMARSGLPNLPLALLEEAAIVHQFSELTHDTVPNAQSFAAELVRLNEFAVLPSHVSAGEHTARLLMERG